MSTVYAMLALGESKCDECGEDFETRQKLRDHVGACGKLAEPTTPKRPTPPSERIPSPMARLLANDPHRPFLFACGYDGQSIGGAQAHVLSGHCERRTETVKSRKRSFGSLSDDDAGERLPDPVPSKNVVGGAVSAVTNSVAVAAETAPSSQPLLQAPIALDPLCDPETEQAIKRIKTLGEQRRATEEKRVGIAAQYAALEKEYGATRASFAGVVAVLIVERDKFAAAAATRSAATTTTN